MLVFGMAHNQNWQPFLIPLIRPLVAQLADVSRDDFVFNAPENNWSDQERDSLREGLELGSTERDNQILQLVIAINNASTVEGFVNFSLPALAKRGWIAAVEDRESYLQRVDALESGIQEMNQEVQANHEDVTNRIFELRVELDLRIEQIVNRLEQNERALVEFRNTTTNQLQQLMCIAGQLQYDNL